MIPRHYNHCDMPRCITCLVERMRIHDEDLYRHSICVSELSWKLAVHLGYPIGDQRPIECAALLHDIGKLQIDVSLLQKAAPLDKREWARMRMHPALGRSILAQEGISDPLIQDVVQNHHERLDGTGYPTGLSGTRISEVVRVISLCDVFAAMTEMRRYDKTYTWQAALERMARKRTRLDQTLLKHFTNMIAANQMQPSGWRQKQACSSTFSAEVNPCRREN